MNGLNNQKPYPSLNINIKNLREREEDTQTSLDYTREC